MREPEVLHVEFNFHPELCTGCGACVAACMDEHNDFTCAIRRLYRQEKRTRSGWKEEWYSVACLHCAEHPCMARCPKQCFSLDAQTGTVQLDSAACVGCGSCERACSFGGIIFDQNHRAVKCDGCLERLREGLLPRCVAACPQAAITVDDRPALREKSQSALAQALKKLDH